MSDYKSAYSEASHYYVSTVTTQSSLDLNRFKRSKKREEHWNENWSKNKVNLNDIIEYFIPDDDPQRSVHSEGGIKFDFEGTRYIIKCDKVAGYLRIYDKEKRMYCKLDGTPTKDRESTHFKIKKREEM